MAEQRRRLGGHIDDLGTSKGATMTDRETTMVLGCTGKTERRLGERLSARGPPVRVG